MKRIIVLIALLFSTVAQAEVTKAKAEYTYKARTMAYATISERLVTMGEMFLISPDVKDLQAIVKLDKELTKVMNAYSGGEMGLCLHDVECKMYQELAVENTEYWVGLREQVIQFARTLSN